MKKTISLILALILVASLVLTGCGDTTSSTPDTSPDNSGASTPEDSGNETPSADDTVYHLTYADTNVDGTGPAMTAQLAKEYIERESNGRVVIDIYLGGTLLEYADLFPGLVDGLADIIYFSMAASSGSMPVGDFFSQKYFCEMPDMKGITACNRLAIDTISAFQEEAEKGNFHYLDIFCTTPSMFQFRDDYANYVNTPEDLKGKIIQSSGNYATALSQIGVSPLALSYGDWYSSFERGIVDGMVLSWTSATDSGCAELVGSYVELGDNGGFGVVGQGILMNNEAWNELPEDLQKIVTDGFRYGVDALVERDMAYDQECKAAEIEAGKIIHHIDQEDMQPWYDLGALGLEIWKEAAKAAGYDADAIVDAYMAIVNDYMANN